GTPVCAGQRGEGERERRFGTGGGDDRCEARVELDACAQEDDVALEGGEPEETDERREGEWAGLVGSRLSGGGRRVRRARGVHLEQPAPAGERAHQLALGRLGPGAVPRPGGAPRRVAK